MLLHISDLSRMACLTVLDLIFSDIMMKVGFDSLERLHRCRSALQSLEWDDPTRCLSEQEEEEDNEVVTRRDVCQSRKKRKIMRERIEINRGPGMLSTNEEISSEAKWAGEGCFMLKFIVKCKYLFSCEAQLNTFTCVLSVPLSVCPFVLNLNFSLSGQLMTAYDNLWQLYDSLW